MILIDDRVGSGDLVDLLPLNLTVKTRLPFADAAFVGNGPEDEPAVGVGIEIKTIGDALQCIGSGRFVGHQLPGLVDSYRVVYLVIEGQTKAGDDGIMLTLWRGGWRPVTLGSRHFLLRDFEMWLTTIETQGGVRVRRTARRKDTAQTILDLYRWWEKPWEDHASLHQFNRSQSTAVLGGRVGLVRRIAAELPGIGWERSQAVAREFPSVHAMVNARREDWVEIDGIGKGIAARVYAALRGKG